MHSVNFFCQFKGNSIMALWDLYANERFSIQDVHNKLDPWLRVRYIKHKLCVWLKAICSLELAVASNHG